MVFDSSGQKPKTGFIFGTIKCRTRKTTYIAVVTVTVAVIEGRQKHILRYVIIILLYFLHAIDDILNNIYIVVVSNL